MVNIKSNFLAWRVRKTYNICALIVKKSIFPEESLCAILLLKYTKKFVKRNNVHGIRSYIADVPYSDAPQEGHFSHRNRQIRKFRRIQSSNVNIFFSQQFKKLKNRLFSQLATGKFQTFNGLNVGDNIVDGTRKNQVTETQMYHVIQLKNILHQTIIV
ncbi:hypothetical protein QTP88_007524 [Uroleucon formosanum]